MTTTEDKRVRRYIVQNLEPLQSFFQNEKREQEDVYTENELMLFYVTHYVEIENPKLDRVMAFIKKLGAKVTTLYC